MKLFYRRFKSTTRLFTTTFKTMSDKTIPPTEEKKPKVKKVLDETQQREFEALKLKAQKDKEDRKLAQSIEKEKAKKENPVPEKNLILSITDLKPLRNSLKSSEKLNLKNPSILLSLSLTDPRKVENLMLQPLMISPPLFLLDWRIIPFVQR
jgi:hypothetical protein